MIESDAPIFAAQTSSPSKHKHVTTVLRQQIIDGSLTPGQRLATRVELQAQFGVACSTIQQALDSLQRDGFVNAYGRRGTFVAHNPPHLAHLAMVFSIDQSFPSHFYTALAREAADLSHIGRRVSVFFGVDGHTDVEDYRQLLAHIRAQRVGGIIFALRPSELIAADLLDLSDATHVPSVVIASEPKDDGVPTTYPDHPAFIERAMTWLHDQGSRRVAWISSSSHGIGRLHDHFQKSAHRHGMQTHPYWIHAVSASAAPWSRNITHLLMQGDQTCRPDALIIADDNLVEPTTRGLMDAGVRIPDDLRIIAHTNFPWPAPAHVPVRRLGFNIHHVFEVCVRAIDAQRRGETVAAMTNIPPVFDDELAIMTNR